MSTEASLESVLQAVEPALRLVHERHLRQILHFLIDRGRVLPTSPDLPYWLSRADLAAADILPREALHGDEPQLLLVTDPDDRMIRDRPRAEQLRIYWRALFRAAVMRAVDRNLATGSLDAEKCRERLNHFGPAAVREIRFVLETEHLAAPEAPDVDVYRVFVAVYLDLVHFTAHGAEEFFPALPHGHAVRDLLSTDVDAAGLFVATRPAGAVDPEREPTPDERWSATPATPSAEASHPPAGGSVGLLKKADEAEAKGNVVRAAILRTQAAGAAQGIDREQAMVRALDAIRQLVDRLGDLLEWDTDTREEWRQALGPLLPLAARGIWPRAARCLYELQRIPADFSRDVFAVDLPEYLRTLGRRPIRRPLPHAKPVMILMAFRKAHKQLLRAGLGDVEQLRLDRLMHHEIHRREHAIRHAFVPIIVKTITDAGLVPANRVEEVARDKLVAELLDRVCERGYLRIGDLRDAIARNQLKLPDLTGPNEFIGGDPLLRADTGLAYALDGVYRRGEFYLRWIQRFVSVFFGTSWGRALTLYLALPFGGAFLTLMFAEELRHIGAKVGKVISRSFEQKTPKAPTAAAAPVPPPGVPTTPAIPAPPAPEAEVGDWQFDEESLEFYWDAPDPEPVGTLATSIKEIRDRASIVETAFTSSATQEHKKSHGSVLIRWPTIVGFGVFLLLVFHVPPFRRMVLVALGYLWWVIRGLLWDMPVAIWHSNLVRAIRLSGTARSLHRHFATPFMLSLVMLGIFFILGVNLRFLVWYGWIGFVLLLGGYNTRWGWLIQDRMAEELSDWWRRVRVNLLPGVIGGIIDLFRMLANWVERQLYAVDEWMRFRGGDSQGSLALKAMLGLIWFPIAYLTRFVFYLLVEPQVNPVKHFPVVTVSHKVIWPLVPQLADWTGWTIGQVSMIINGIPGIFGFIAWELKENWRLYAANRPPILKPVMLGSHGESMRGLLRPGFHSGTVPKIHRKSRKALATGDRAKVSLLHHELEHAAEGVHRFAERELVPLLLGSKNWGGIVVEVTGVRFGVQRAEIELSAPSLGRDACVLAFENVGGQIEAQIAARGWMDKLTDTQHAVLIFALRGLFDMAASVSYDARPRTTDAPEEPGYGALARRVSWEEWVKRWEFGKDGVKG